MSDPCLGSDPMLSCEFLLLANINILPSGAVKSFSKVPPPDTDYVTADVSKGQKDQIDHKWGY
jgi:hypothetical protein